MMVVLLADQHQHTRVLEEEEKIVTQHQEKTLQHDQIKDQH